MFMSPSCASLAIFADKNSQSHAGATITGLAALTKFHQPVAQFNRGIAAAVGEQLNGLARGSKSSGRRPAV
jgi:hypothetical protein